MLKSFGLFTTTTSTLYLSYRLYKVHNILHSPDQIQKDIIIACLESDKESTIVHKEHYTDVDVEHCGVEPERINKSRCDNAKYLFPEYIIDSTFEFDREPYLWFGDSTTTFTVKK